MTGSSFRKTVVPRQCYVEEQAKPREQFMVDAYKILKSLMKSIKRLIVHLSTDEEHIQQSNVQAIQILVMDSLTALTDEGGDNSTLIHTVSKKDQ
jgi:hypothetical protein